MLSKFKKYQLIVGGLLILNLPLSYVILKLGMGPQSTMYISILISIIALFSRLIILKPLIFLSINKFLKQVVLTVLLVALCSFFIPGFISYNLNFGIDRLLLVFSSSIICTLTFIYFIGLDYSEKEIVHSKIATILNRS